jgi:hypothetical protein
VNDAGRRKTLERIAREAEALALAVGEVHEATGTTVIDRIRQAAPGLRAAVFDAPRRSGGVSDPAGRAAVDARPDPTVNVLAEFDDLMRTVANSLDRARRIVDGHGPPRRPNAADRLAVARDNQRVEPGCESCSRIPAEPGGREPWWQEVDPRIPLGTRAVSRTPATSWVPVPRLDHPMRLCPWCYRFLCDRWRLPTIKELEARRAGKPVMMPANEETLVRERVTARVAEHTAAVLAGEDQERGRQLERPAFERSSPESPAGGHGCSHGDLDDVSDPGGHAGAA